MKRAGALAAATGIVLAAALTARPAPEPVEHRETLFVFGTLLEIVIRGSDADTAARATAAAGATLQAMHDDWHPWRAGAMSRINAAIAEGQSAPIDPALAGVLRRSARLSCLSGGTFDPAIGGLVALWGFHADAPPEGGPPAPEAVTAYLAKAPGIADLTLAAGRVGSANPAVRIDLGGVGKGAALDAAEAVLRAAGARDAVLNAGGDVNVMGAHGGRSWRVAIRDPFAWGAVAAVEMRPGEAIYTSGNYERYFEQGGIRFAHILDPRTGYPVADVVSATVLHADGLVADAAATALAVAGPEGWAQVAADMGVTEALLIDGAGRVFASPAMAARLTWRDPDWPAPEIVPLPPAQAAACAGSGAAAG